MTKTTTLESTLQPTHDDPVSAVVGAVTINRPNARGYFRLKWIEPDGTRGDTSGGRTLDQAVEKANDIDNRISLAAGPKATTPLRAVVEEFLALGRSPYKNKVAHKQSHLNQLRSKLERCLRVAGNTRAMDVDRALCDLMRSQGHSDNAVRELTTTLRAFLVWGEQHNYFTHSQAELLPRSCTMPAPALYRKITRPDGVDTGRAVRMNGQDERYIHEEDAPSRDWVIALRVELARRFPTWGELAPEFAAATGARWGEQFQLTAHDVHLDGCSAHANPHVHVDWQVAASGTGSGPTGRRDTPKGSKRRSLPLPTLTFTGYGLRDAVRERVVSALAEQRTGTNDEALLFPAARGGMLWHTSFNGDHLIPAMKAAGLAVNEQQVEQDVWDEKRARYVRSVSSTRSAGLTWHSLRHRFARTAVDDLRMPEGELMAVGGWENIATVQTRYYRSGMENMNRALAYFV